MLLILRSIVLSSAATAASVSVVFAPVPAEPVVTPDRAFDADPELWAVPAALVPGGGGNAWVEELAAPPGLLRELVCPAAVAGPDVVSVRSVGPAPGDTAAGVPIALEVAGDDREVVEEVALLPLLPLPPPPCAQHPVEPPIRTSAAIKRTAKCAIGRSPLSLTSNRGTAPPFREPFRRCSASEFAMAPHVLLDIKGAAVKQ